MHAEALSRLRNSLENGEIVSESGEGYEDKSYAIAAARKFGPRDAVIFTND